MLKVGLTGGIGSGKSTVAAIFSVLGVPVYYADDAAKQLMDEDENVKERIQRNFGEDAYKDGLLNRKYLSGIVFNNADKLTLLNSIVHPATIKDADKWIHKQTSHYVIKEAALLFESGAHEKLDYIIGVQAPLNLRILRAMKRDNVSREEILSRMNKQIDEEIKLSLCDFIIINDEQQLVLPQVLQLHERLLQLSTKLPSPL
jgi:dephospho-CoA kinase